MRQPPVDTAASVSAKLLRLSRNQGENFQRLLQRYAIERFLARLSRSPEREQFVLKGAMLFVVWGGSASRPTRDLDLLGFGAEGSESVERRIRNILALEPPEPDGLVFELETLTAEPIREAAEYEGTRITLRARLAQAKFPVQVDIAFGEAVVPAPRWIEFPTLLAGAPIAIRAYPHEVSISEKLHAAVTLGDANSRLKDFHDLCAIPRLFELDDDSVAKAIGTTFERRATPLPPSIEEALPEAFFANAERAEQWSRLIEREGWTFAPRDFGAVGAEIHRALRRPLRIAHSRMAGLSE